MKISAPSRAPLGLGRDAKARLFSAAIAASACLAFACSDDDPATQTGIGGNTSTADVDASVRELPGDGREGTPEFDTESRQRNPIGPRRLVETIDRIQDDLNGGAGAGAGDAGPADVDPVDGGAN